MRMQGTGAKRGFWPRFKVRIERPLNPDGGDYGTEEASRLVAQSLATATGCRTSLHRIDGWGETPRHIGSFDPQDIDETGLRAVSAAV